MSPFKVSIVYELLLRESIFDFALDSDLNVFSHTDDTCRYFYLKFNHNKEVDLLKKRS